MKLASLALLFVGLLCQGCNPADTKELSSDAGKLAKTATRAAGNAQLVARVSAVLASKKGVSMEGLHIEATQGIVTVGGHVRNPQERIRVMETVREVQGVDGAIDKLRIAN